MAIGSGHKYAVGAIHNFLSEAAHHNINSAKLAIMSALKTASEFDNYTKPPFIIESIAFYRGETDE